MDPYILNIETSTEVCSVALQHGAKLIHQLTEESPFSHSKKLTVLIKQLFEESSIELNQLDAISLSEGPGSYTGLRVGSAVAKGLCFSLDCAFIAINTLDIIANKIEQPDNYDYIIPTLDARRDEAYISIIQKKNYHLKDNPHIFISESFAHLGGVNILVCGNAADKASKLIDAPNIKYKQYSPNAVNMLSLSITAFERGDFRNIDSFAPNYIKAPNITVSKKKLL